LLPSALLNQNPGVAAASGLSSGQNQDMTNVPTVTSVVYDGYLSDCTVPFAITDHN
jgi:hypothetical protein